LPEPPLLSEDRRDAVARVSPVIVRLRVCAARERELAPGRLVSEQRESALRELCRIRPLDQPAAIRRREALGRADRARGYDRQPARLRLRYDEPERIVPRRIEEDVERGEPTLRPTVLRPMHRAPLGDERMLLRPIRPPFRTDDQKPRVGPNGNDPRRAVEK